MANTSSALKEIRKNARRRARNRVIRVATRTQVKKAQQTLASGHTAESEQEVRAAMQALDKAAQKGIIHKNNAARRKARLAKKLRAAQAANKPA